MRLEYGSVTSVFKDPTLGAQLCHVKGNLTSAEYQNCEIITPKGINYIPRIGDTVVVVEMYNSEIAVLGILDPFDIDIVEGETIMHGGTVAQGQSQSYNLQTKVKMNKDGEIEMFRGDTVNTVFKSKQRVLLNKDDEIEIETLLEDGTSKAKITLYPDGKIDIVNQGKTTIQSATKIELIAPSVEVI